MSVISGALATAITHAVAAKSAPVQTPSSSSAGFGSATHVTLSAAAQSAVASQSSGAGTSSGSGAAGGAGGGGGGGVPITTISSATDTALLVELADQEVIPKVGVTGASEVVDSKGDISTIKLNELIAQQTQQASQQQAANSILNIKA